MLFLSYFLQSFFNLYPLGQNIINGRLRARNILGTPSLLYEFQILSRKQRDTKRLETAEMKS